MVYSIRGLVGVQTLVPFKLSCWPTGNCLASKLSIITKID